MQCELIFTTGSRVVHIRGDVQTFITSPFYPGSSFGNVNVIWNIVTDEGFKISIQFIEFRTSLNVNFLRAGDGVYSLNATSEFFLWSGSKLPPRLLSSSSAMWLRFTSISTSPGNGFNISVTSVPSNGITVNSC